MGSYAVNGYWQLGYSKKRAEAAYVEQGYWQAGYTPVPIDQVSCNILSVARLVASTTGTTTGADLKELENRVAVLEAIVKDFLKAEDVQPLFNKDIKEVIFDA